MTHSTTIQPFAATQIAPSLTLWGGTYTVSCSGLDRGDYLVTAPGKQAEVVTVTQDYHGTRFYTCTCDYDLFTTPRADVQNCCPHVGLVGLFLGLDVETLAASLHRQVRWMRLAIRKRLEGAANESAIERRATRAGELQYWLNQRRAATVRYIPQCVTEQQEAAQAASILVLQLDRFLSARPILPQMAA